MAGLKITVPSFALTYDKKLLRQTLRSAGTEIAAVAKALIRGSHGGGRKYGRHTASAPGQPPASLSGDLASSIKVRPWRNGEGVSIRDTEFYALFLEKGAKGGGGDTRNKANMHLAGTFDWRKGKIRTKNRMKKSAISQTRVLAPRPFLTTALEQRQQGIADRVRAAVVDGIKFKKLKA
jgi:hypothetical protein